MRRLAFLAVAAAVLLGAVLLHRTTARSYVGTVPAPELPAGLDWVNTSRPLTLRELRGKVVLLDFWTYGCINCIHVIPDLKALEEKYADELVVVGVHSAKFLNEGVTQNIEAIAQRYGRTEPIVNDNAFEVWRAYGVRAWPTLVLIDPEGNIVARHEGERVFAPFDEAIAGVIAAFEERGTLDRTPLDLAAEGPVAPRTALRFPEGVLADEAGGRLFIADSGQNRIVVTDLTGKVLDVIGSSVPELRDGPFESAGFDWPHGMALASPSELYVADTGNHAIRLVDLARRTVSTVAGNGKQEYMFGTSSVPATSGLNSPWDVLWQGGQLFIAMAGQHQVWRYDPATATVELHAGSGREELRDGPALTAGLNQPSGLATDGEALFVADAEASAVRRVDAEPGGQVVTIVGTGLFDFGDVDGTGDAVRLQHPQGVAYADGAIYVADTYNHKVKRIDPLTRESVTLVGTGAAGWRDGAAGQLDEPTGLSVAGRALYVADTNNDVIRVVDLGSREVTTLELSDPSALLTRPAQAARRQADEVVELPAATVRPGAGSLALTLTLPEGYVANHLAPMQASWSSSASAVQLPGSASATVDQPDYPLVLEFPALFTAGEAVLSGNVLVYYCREVATELCLIRQVELRVPVEVRDADAGGASSGRVVELAWQPPALPEGY